jgi:hypothetical protein
LVEPMSTHPLQRRPRQHRRLALVCVAVATLLPTVLGAIEKPLKEDRPGGASIVDFELAGSVHRAREIRATWSRQGVLDDAKRIQVFDVLYPLIYAAALAGGCLAAAGAWRRAGRRRPASAGVPMAWLATAAAAFDYVENVGLDVTLWGHAASPWPQLSYAAALLKFSAIAVTLAYALSGLLAAAVTARRPPPRPA